MKRTILMAAVMLAAHVHATSVCVNYRMDGARNSDGTRAVEKVCFPQLEGYALRVVELPAFFIRTGTAGFVEVYGQETFRRSYGKDVVAIYTGGERESRYMELFFSSRLVVPFNSPAKREDVGVIGEHKLRAMLVTEEHNYGNRIEPYDALVRDNYNTPLVLEDCEGGDAWRAGLNTSSVGGWRARNVLINRFVRKYLEQMDAPRTCTP